jgi:Secretion system C-terminal sorting domain
MGSSPGSHCIAGVPETLPKSNQITLTPNPANRQIIVSGAAGMLFTITDILGKQWDRSVLQHKEQSLDISGLADGLYFISFIDPASGQRQQLKFLKN